MSIRLIIYVFVVPVVVLSSLVGIILFVLSPIKRGHRISVELRGAHLVWWLAWAATVGCTVSGWFLDLPRCLFGSLVAVAIGGAVAKVYVPFVGLLSGVWGTEMRYNGRYEGWRRYYLFWARGILPVAIALAPGLAYILWCLASGWMRAW